MSSNKKRINAREFWMVFRHPASIACAAFGGFAGIVSAFTVIEDISTICVRLLPVGLTAFFVVLVFLTVRSIRIAQSASLKQAVVLKRASTITLMEGDYVENLLKVKKEMEEANLSLENIVCVSGFTRNLDLESTTEGSVLMALIKAIAQRDGGCNDADSLSLTELLEVPLVVEFNKKIELAVEDYWRRVGMEGKGANAGKAPFGAGIFVDLPLLEDARTGKCGKLLLIVNSQQCKEAPYALREIDTIMGPDSIDVIPCVFELVRDVHLKILFMPSIGTKRLSSAYQAVVASVISRYLCSMLECRRPYSLVFSVQAADLEENGMSLVRVKRYVREAIKLFS